MTQSQKHIGKLGDQTQVQQQMLKDSQCLLLPTYPALVPDTSPQPEMGWSWMFWRRKPWGRLPTLALKLKQCTEYYFKFSDSEKSKSFTRDKLYYCNRFCSNWHFCHTLFFQTYLPHCREWELIQCTELQQGIRVVLIWNISVLKISIFFQSCHCNIWEPKISYS